MCFDVSGCKGTNIIFSIVKKTGNKRLKNVKNTRKTKQQWEIILTFAPEIN